MAFGLLLLSLPSPLLAQSFRQAPTFATGKLPQSVAAGDFNLDGKTDLAVANGLSDDVSILLGDGSGGFASAMNHYALGPVALVSEDFNGDGLLDLAVARSLGKLSIWLGNGGGNFPTQTQSVVIGDPESMSAADFNNDGDVDLAVGLWDPISSNYAVAVLLGDGLGEFSTAVSHEVGYGASSIAIADFNSDLNVDLAIANNHANTLSLLFGDGAGGFGAFSAFVVGPVWAGTTSVVAADLDGDGWVDLAAANAGSNDVAVLAGNGAGGFDSPEYFSVGFAPWVIASEDINGDERLDLAVANRYGDNVSILLSDDLGDFQRTTADYGAGREPIGLMIADFNGDRVPDLAIANSGEYGTDSAADVSILVGDGTGGFPGAVHAYRSGSGPLALTMAELNGDGNPDLVAANQSSKDISVLLGNGGGTFESTANYGVSAQLTDVVAADFNRDGSPDLAATKYTSAGTVAVLLNDGDGSFGAPTDFTAIGFPSSLAAADFNGDGNQDLFVLSWGTMAVLLMGDGGGGFSTGANFGTGGADGAAAIVGDFNDDKKVDVAVANYGSHDVSIGLGNGLGGFSPAAKYAAGNFPHSVAVGDFNGDGKQDLVVANSSVAGGPPAAVTILLGSGAGTFGPPHSFSAGDGTLSVAVGDINGDGRQDVAAANFLSGDVSILSGDGTGALLPPVDFTVGSFPSSLVVADFDADEKQDVAVVHAHDRGDIWVLVSTTKFQKADLAVAKDDGTTVAVPGSALSYTITVTNLGPDPVTSLRLKDAVPPALLGPVFTPIAGSYDPASSLWTGLALPAGHSVTMALTGTVDPMATGTLVNTATVATAVGVLDPSPGNDSATDTDTLAPAANLVLAMTDSPDPVAAGGALDYTLTVTNLGTAQATGVMLVDPLPPAVDFLSTSPGPPVCTLSAGTVACALGNLDMGASKTVTIHTTARRFTMAMNQATVAANEADPVAGDNAAEESTLILFGGAGELTHGALLWEDLGALPGPLAGEDVFRLVREPRSSYEVVVDAASGDVSGASGVLLQRVDADLVTALQDSVPVGAGFGRSLRVENASDQSIDHEAIRVASAGCTTDCGPDDVYRIRAYETTYTIPRFNNTDGQVTILVLHNRGSETVSGNLWFWSPAGALLADHGFTMTPQGGLVLDTTTLPGASSASGSITVSNDGAYGIVEGKAVSLEPGTGFTFDTPMVARTP